VTGLSAWCDPRHLHCPATPPRRTTRGRCGSSPPARRRPRW
jgi:hypothetical protein